MLKTATKIRFLKIADRCFGSLLIKLLSRPSLSKNLFGNKGKRILVIRPGGIGDAALLIPALQFLKQQIPDALIDVLAEQRNAAVFNLCPVVNHVLRYDEGDLLSVLRSSYDIVIDTEQWHRLTAVVTRLVRSPVKVGYGTNERKKLYTHAVDYSHDRYELDSFSDLLRPLALANSMSSSVPFLTIPDTDRPFVQQLLTSLGDRPYVVLFPGASIAERRWGAGNFHQLARKLSKSGYPVVIIGGHEDQIDGDAIMTGVDGLNLAGQTSLVGSAAVVGRAALLVSGDSGMLHIGVGLGLKTVSLFGSGIAAKWAPRGDRHAVLNKQLSCSPCTRFGYTPPCPIGIRCLSEISVDEVFVAAHRLLAQKPEK